MSSQKKDVDVLRSVTMKAALGCPSLLNSLVYAGSSYQLFFASHSRATKVLRLEAYNETLRHVRQEIEEAAKDEVPDALLLTIAILAIHGSIIASEQMDDSVPNEPHYRDNLFYSRTPWEPAHVQGLLSLTVRKGGITSISMNPLAVLIFLYGNQSKYPNGDILTAIQD